jgi:predicted nucleotide-binding protein
MDKNMLLAKLAAAGLGVREDARNGNDSGWRVVLENGAIVNCFDTGKVNIQGKNTDVVRAALDMPGPASVSAASPKQAASRKVFVVYGHDDSARTELEAMLRRWNLEPLILDQLTSGGQTIIEKLESVRKEANFAVVLATPDDEGHRKDHPDEKALRARQNVVLELGMMLALLGRPRVAILVKSAVNMERPSDIQGLLYIAYKETVSDAKLTLAKEINAQGIKIDLDRV